MEISFSPEDNKATITCQIVGQPTPKVTWKLEDKVLQPSESVVMTFDETTGDVRLDLYETPANNVNLYTVEIDNDWGSAIGTAEIILEDNQVVAAPVMRAPRVTPLNAITVPNKSTLQMKSSFTGMPEPTVAWLKNGKELVPDRDVTIVTKEGTSTLTVKNMDRKRAGKYEIVATNEAGESRASGSVMVSDEVQPADLKAPLFLKTLEPKTVLSSEIVILEAEVDSNPLSSFQWFFNSKPLECTPEIRVHSVDNKSIAILENFTFENNGIYMCRAENVAGSVTSSTTVKTVDNEAQLEEKPQLISPRFVTKLKPAQLMDGESMTLICRVAGEPTPKIQWLHDKQPIAETRGITILQDADGFCVLNIPEVFPEDGGVYTCRATNKIGKAVTKADVAVEGIMFNVYNSFNLSVCFRNSFACNKSKRKSNLTLIKM